MREIYPPHYAAFHCIAGACPDSCCKEWEIVVDAESVEKYQMVSGTVPLLHQRQFLGSIQTAAEAAFHIVPVLGFPLIGT